MSDPTDVNQSQSDAADETPALVAVDGRCGRLNALLSARPS